MPIYEYRCDNGHTFEVMQRMADDALTECTECGAPVQRVFHPVAIHFKGKGFYNTDYGKKSRRASSPSDGEGGGKEGRGAASWSEGEGGDKSDKADKKEPATSTTSKPDSGSSSSSSGSSS